MLLTPDNPTVAGFMVGKKAEAGGIAKDGAKMVMAVANVKVGTLTHSSAPDQAAAAMLLVVPRLT